MLTFPRISAFLDHQASPYICWKSRKYSQQFCRMLVLEKLCLYIVLESYVYTKVNFGSRMTES